MYDALVASVAAERLRAVSAEQVRLSCRLSAERGESIDSMNLLLYMAPIAALALVPATVLLEPDSITTARALAVEHPCEQLSPAP